MPITQRDRQILRIAGPSIVSNITVPLLGLVDVAIVGHLGDAAYIGAIAVGSMAFNLIYWIFGFLRMGTSGMTSQAFGRRDLACVMQLLVRSLTVALAVALTLIVLQWPLEWTMVRLMRPTADVEPWARTYFSICIWARRRAGALRTDGMVCRHAEHPHADVHINHAERGQHLCKPHVCLWTGHADRRCGHGHGHCPVCRLCRSHSASVASLRPLGRYMVWRGVLQRNELWRFFTVNRDIFLRTLCLVAVNLYFTSAGARQGAVILAVNTVLMQLFLLFSYIMDGFANAGEALGGRYVRGAHGDAFRDTVRRLFLWGLFMAAAFTVVYAIGGMPFLRLLTDDEAVISASSAYFPWALVIPLCSMAAFVWDGIFIGVTATRGMLVSLAVSASVFFVTFFCLSPWLGNHALWLAMTLYLAVRGMVQTVLYRRDIAGKI